MTNGLGKKNKIICFLKLDRPSLTFKSIIGISNYFETMKILKILCIIFSLSFFSLFYINNSFKKRYSITYLDPFNWGAFATQRRGIWRT
jgi:hypothetical protein